MYKKITNLLLCIGVIGLFHLSCSGRVPQGGFNPKPPTGEPTAEPPAKPTAPPVGTEVDIKFLQTFNPAYAAGMKYTKIQTNMNTNKAEEITEDITAVTEESVKVKIKNSLGIKETTFPIADYTNPQHPLEPSAKVKFKYAGTEDVKVPADEFKGAAKITLTNANGTFTGWIVPGIGTVKKTFTDAKKLTIKTELKEFKEK